MINGIKSQVDKLWTEFWTGGITNPLMVIEQISFLMFARLLDIRESREEKKAGRTRRPFKRIFADDEQHLRWSQFKNKTPADAMLNRILGSDQAKRTPVKGLGQKEGRFFLILGSDQAKRTPVKGLGQKEGRFLALKRCF